MMRLWTASWRISRPLTIVAAAVMIAIGSAIGFIVGKQFSITNIYMPTQNPASMSYGLPQKSTEASNIVRADETPFIKSPRVAYEDTGEGRQLYLFGEATTRLHSLTLAVQYSARTPLGGWEPRSSITRIGPIPESIKGERIKVSLTPRDMKPEEAWNKQRYLGRTYEGDYPVPIRVMVVILSDDGREQQYYPFIAFMNDPRLLLSGSELDFIKQWEQEDAQKK